MGRARNIWSAIIIAVTAATVLLVWLNLRAYLEADRQVGAARRAQQRIYELTIILQDAESGARGYALTSGPRHRAIFERSAADVESRMDAAEQAVQGIDRMQDFQPLKGLILRRLDFLREMVTLTTGGQPTQAAQLLEGDSADSLGLSVRQEVTALIEYTNRVLEDRLTTCRQCTMAMTRWVTLGMTALLLSGAVLVSYIVCDARQQRQLAAELRTARDGALAGAQARDDFLNALSHELRTPLTPALLYVSGMEKRAPPQTEERKELALVRRQLELEARLIDDLLDVSRILRGDVVLRTEQVSIHTLLKHLCDILRDDFADAQLKATCSLEALNDNVVGNESRLHQVFWHLLANAIRFTPPNGAITVATSNTDGKIVITITDSGAGMTEQQLPSIFEAFATAKSTRTHVFGGLGVGLAIVKSVVEMHAGCVTVHSEGKGQGASFRVELPVVGGGVS